MNGPTRKITLINEIAKALGCETSEVQSLIDGLSNTRLERLCELIKQACER